MAKSALTKALETWTARGGDLSRLLPPHQELGVEGEEAQALIKALDAFIQNPNRSKNSESDLRSLVGLFQMVQSDEAVDTLTSDGLPRLRRILREGMGGVSTDQPPTLAMKVLAMYRQAEDVEAIAQAARNVNARDEFPWSMVFEMFKQEHPHAGALVEALRGWSPKGFMAITFYEVASAACRDGQLDRHPFDSDEGSQQIEKWLRDKNEDRFSYAVSATAGLPFLEERRREPLLRLAESHPDPHVRLEAAWARVKSGDYASLDRLVEFSLDPVHSKTAVAYLRELGFEDRIPEQATDPEFVALAEMAQWLAHPNEFGRPPDALELMDSRELHWPPTDDRRRMFIFKYTYNELPESDDDDDELDDEELDGDELEADEIEDEDSEDDEEEDEEEEDEEDEDDENKGGPDIGVGLVGGVTFALFGDTNADMSPEDIYAIHCCWELAVNHDPRAPKKSSAAAGRKLLREKNPGF